MTTSAAIGRAPYLVEVRPRICECRVGGKDLSCHRDLVKAVAVASGYWNVYLAFFGDQTYWLEFSIVDRRDGKLLWRNGRHVGGEQNGK